MWNNDFQDTKHQFEGRDPWRCWEMKWTIQFPKVSALKLFPGHYSEKGNLTNPANFLNWGDEEKNLEGLKCLESAWQNIKQKQATERELQVTNFFHVMFSWVLTIGEMTQGWGKLDPKVRGNSFWWSPTARTNTYPFLSVWWRIIIPKLSIILTD